MIREYMLDDAENMIELAVNVQSNVYWGGQFFLGKTLIKWKDFWTIVSAERACKSVRGVQVINNEEVKFIYSEDIE